MRINNVITAAIENNAMALKTIENN